MGRLVAVLASVLLACPALGAQAPTLTETITGTITPKNPVTGVLDTSRVRVSGTATVDSVRTRIDTAAGGLVISTLAYVSGPRLKIQSQTVRYGTSTSGGETPPLVGIPFGGFSLPDGHRFTLDHGSTRAGDVIADIARARARRGHLNLVMTGGHHNRNYAPGGDRFDVGTWQARMDAFDTPAIRQAIAQGVADGTILVANVMDEPNVYGAGDGNTHGPRGWMSKARVDSLCAHVKQMFPTLTVGVAHNYTAFEPSQSYEVCEVVISQYASRLGSVTAWRDGALAMARRDGYAVMFSFNPLDGGTQDRTGAWDCPGLGKGTYAPNCRMTAAQFTEAALVLGNATCGGLLFWRYEPSLFNRPDMQAAVATVQTRLAKLPRTPCRRVR